MQAITRENRDMILKKGYYFCTNILCGCIRESLSFVLLKNAPIHVVSFLFFVFFLSLIVLFSGCSSSQLFSMMGVKDEVDSSLPTIQTFRALPDVTSIGFEWKVPEGNLDSMSGYVIYRKNSKGKFDKIGFIKNILSTHYYDSKLNPQTEYEYAIAIVGRDSKVSEKSDILKVKTSFIDPVDFVYTSQNYAGRIKIFWSPSPNPVVKNYIIQRQDLKSGKFINIGSTSNRMSVEYFDNELDNGIQYTYRVISQSYDGAKSVPSKIAIGQTRAAPNVIEGIVTTNNKPHAIWIEWNPSDNKDVIGYSIWVSDSQQGNYTKLAFVRSTSYIDKIEENGAVRYYKVSAQDSYKLESNLQDTPTKGQTLSPPQTPRITKSGLENNATTLVWDSTTDNRAESYIVYRTGGGYGAPNRFGGITNTNFVDKNMQKGVVYSYYVVSVDKFGIESLPSEVITLSIPLETKKEESLQSPSNSDSPSGNSRINEDSTSNAKKTSQVYFQGILVDNFAVTLSYDGVCHSNTPIKSQTNSFKMSAVGHYVDLARFYTAIIPSTF